MPFSLSADLEFIASRLDRKEEVGYLVQASISKAKQMEAEEVRLCIKLSQIKADYADLKAKYDKLSSDEGWKQSADWAQRSGGTL